MGTLLKYIFYVILVIVVYLVGRGIYEGQINEKTTVGQVMDDVGQGTKNIVKQGVDATVNATDDALNTTEDKTKEVIDAAQNKADEYKVAPKEQVVVD